MLVYQRVSDLWFQLRKLPFQIIRKNASRLWKHVETEQFLNTPNPPNLISKVLTWHLAAYYTYFLQTYPCDSLCTVWTESRWLKGWILFKSVKQPTSSIALSGWCHHATHSFQLCWLHPFKNQTNSGEHSSSVTLPVFSEADRASKVCLALLAGSSQFASKPYTCLCVVTTMTPLTMKL